MVAAMLLLTLRGTPTMYYGDEISIPQVPIPEEEQMDPQGLLMPGRNLSRDPQRTPMQWDREEHSGFTTGEPWLRLSEDHRRVNVQLQLLDENSILIFYKRLISLRQSEASLQKGDYDHLSWNENLLAYVRRAPSSDGFLVVLNLTNKTSVMNLQSFQGVIELSTNREAEGLAVSGDLTVEPNTGIIIRLR